MSYHLTQTDVSLLYPQTYHHMHGGYYEVYDSQVSMYLSDHLIHITIDRDKKNIPLVYNSFISDNKKRFISPQMHSALSHTIISKFDIFGDLCSINNLQAHGISVSDATLDN